MAKKYDAVAIGAGAIHPHDLADEQRDYAGPLNVADQPSAST
jgi:hypothetical protein